MEAKEKCASGFEAVQQAFEAIFDDPQERGAGYRCWLRRHYLWLDDRRVDSTGRRLRSLYLYPRANLRAQRPGSAAEHVAPLAFTNPSVGPRQTRAFGHVELGVPISFADPEGDVSFGFVTTTMGSHVLMDPRVQELAPLVYAAL